MPLRFQVQGGRPLSGTVRPAGNKNAALPILAATLLADGPVDLANVPRIRDVESMVGAARGPGRLGRVDRAQHAHDRCPRRGEQAARSGALRPDPRLDSASPRPLLARFGKVVLPPPGGDVIGRRRVDTHFLALEALGARSRSATATRSRPGTSSAPTSSSTSPASPAPRTPSWPRSWRRGRTVLRNAAGEPHVQDLARLPGGHGRAASRGSAPTSTSSRAASRCTAPATRSGPTTSRSASFIGLAAVTNGALTIDPVRRRRAAQHPVRVRPAGHPAPDRRDQR